MVKARGEAPKRKCCKICSVAKPYSEFYVYRNPQKNGVVKTPMSYCKACDKRRKPRKRRKVPLRKTPLTYEEKKNKKTAHILQKRRKNPRDRLMHRLRERVRVALKTKSKSASTTTLLGCTAAECVRWIESQMTSDMCWENIHVDHMMPVASFDLRIESEQQKCFHYTNLQPLTKIENLQKSAKVVYKMKWTGREWLIAKGDSLFRPRRTALNLP